MNLRLVSRIIPRNWTQSHDTIRLEPSFNSDNIPNTFWLLLKIINLVLLGLIIKFLQHHSVTSVTAAFNLSVRYTIDVYDNVIVVSSAYK